MLTVYAGGGTICAYAVVTWEEACHPSDLHNLRQWVSTTLTLDGTKAQRSRVQRQTDGGSLRSIAAHPQGCARKSLVLVLVCVMDGRVQRAQRRRMGAASSVR